MSRKLASVQSVKAIRPIEGADRIEVVQILNWDCVARKGEFNVGDRVIYFEIDSLLPDIPAFEFLKGSSWSQKLNKYKIKTHKMRGQISQGLVVPIKDLEEIDRQIHNREECVPIAYCEGYDLTEILGIEKYEPPVSNGSLGELIHHEWYVPKTDEERIQVCANDVLPVYIQAQDANAWYASIKLDGTSCTAGLFEDAFLIGGRNQWYKGPNMYTETVKKHGDLEEAIKEFHRTTGKYIVFQGELCGPGIQSNKLGLTEKEWFIFNVFVSDTGKMDSYKKCDYTQLIGLTEIFNLKTVPIIKYEDKPCIDPNLSIDENVNELLKYVDTLKYRTYFEDASPNQVAEGIVVRMNNMTNSFKVVSNKFLLKGGE